MKIQSHNKKELITILILAVLSGIVVFYCTKLVDKSIAEVTNARLEIDNLRRIADSRKEYIEEYKAIEDYKNFLDQNLPQAQNLIDILEQLEKMSRVANVSLTMKLEEGTVGGETIQFKSEKEKQDFLKTLNIKDYSSTQSTGSSAATGTSTGKTVNIALEMQQNAQTTENASSFKISYIDIDLSAHGSYMDIRSFISLFDSSKYFFDIKELRMNKQTDGYVDSTIQLRAFIFSK
jgi:hypothetical protein